MGLCVQLTVIVCVLLCWNEGLASVFRNNPDVPICTSYSGLCDMSFEILQNGPYGVPKNYLPSGPMCQCPGRSKCPSNSASSPNVLYLELLSSDMIINTRLSYCDSRSIPKRTCKPDELSVTLKGYGPIIAEIVGDVICRCDGPLTLSRSKPDGVYSITEYTCGRPICEVNRIKRPVCERVVKTASMYGSSLITEIPCQCPEGFQCATYNLDRWSDMFESPKVTEAYCKMV